MTKLFVRSSFVMKHFYDFIKTRIHKTEKKEITTTSVKDLPIKGNCRNRTFVDCTSSKGGGG